MTQKLSAYPMVGNPGWLYMNCLVCMENNNQVFDLSSAKLLSHCYCDIFSEFYGKTKKVTT